MLGGRLYGREGKKGGLVVLPSLMKEDMRNEDG